METIPYIPVLERWLLAAPANDTTDGFHTTTTTRRKRALTARVAARVAECVRT